MVLKMSNMSTNLIDLFLKADTTDYPDFDNYKTPLDMGLWVLWLAKEKLNIDQLDAKEIASIIVNVKEKSIEPESIINAFNRAKGKRVHVIKNNNRILYKIMKEGKDYLLSKVKQESIQAFYFTPGKKYSARKILTKDILKELKGNIDIVDPYYSERTLYILKDIEGIKNKKIRFLLRLDSIKDAHERKKFLNELADFKKEFPDIEFRNYSNRDIHDRYIISANYLVVVGQGIKDFGNKESFIILLSTTDFSTITQAISKNFEDKWKASTPI